MAPALGKLAHYEEGPLDVCVAQGPAKSMDRQTHHYYAYWHASHCASRQIIVSRLLARLSGRCQEWAWCTCLKRRGT
jgi:hypothetical protein